MIRFGPLKKIKDIFAKEDQVKCPYCGKGIPANRWFDCPLCHGQNPKPNAINLDDLFGKKSDDESKG